MRAAPRKPAALRDAARGRLSRPRAEALSQRFARFMLAEWRAGRTCTIFGHEGALGHALRALLCLQGWRWRPADDAAKAVVAEALRRANARRPSWAEGQREVEERFIARTRCTICHRPLPEGHRMYCSDTCGAVAHARQNRLRRADAARSYEIAAGQ